MVGDVIHPLNIMFFGPGVYEAVAKVSTVVRIKWCPPGVSTGPSLV